MQNKKEKEKTYETQETTCGQPNARIVLAMVLMVSGITMPVQADTLPAAEESTAYEQQAENVESTEHYQEPENQEVRNSGAGRSGAAGSG